MSTAFASGVGALPKGWTVTTLGALGNYWNGRGFKKSEWRNHGRQIIRIQDLTGTGGKPNYFDGKADERNIVREGDLLVSWAATLGVFVWRGSEAVLNQHIFKVESFINKHFHRYLIAHSLDDLRRQTHGSGMVHITRGRFDSTPVYLPPLAEQSRIVAAIEEQFSRLDAGVESLERARRNLRRLRSAVLRAAVEGRLVPQDDRDEPASLLIDRVGQERRLALEAAGHKVKEPVTPAQDNLPSLPGGWEWSSLDALAEIVGGVTKDAKRQVDPAYLEVPYLRVANVQRGFLDLSVMTNIRVPREKVEQLRLRRGDVLFTEGGDRDKLGRGWVWEGQIESCIHQNHVFRARLYSSGMQPRFVSWHGNTFGQSWFARGGKQTTNLASVSLTTLRGFPVPIPPAAEQERIVAEVDRQLSLIAAMEATLDTERARSSRLRQSVLSSAFQGGLTSQDSQDGQIP